jgi:hypothetical protein
VEKFTALLHHVTADLLREAYYGLKQEAAPGIDGVTWRAYGDGLEGKLEDLHERVHRGSYRAQPSRRRYIPKPDGRQRPLGIAALEDKIVQRAVVEVLNTIYEEDFLGFSYGFRPGRSQHGKGVGSCFNVFYQPISFRLPRPRRNEGAGAGSHEPGACEFAVLNSGVTVSTPFRGKFPSVG